MSTRAFPTRFRLCGRHAPRATALLAAGLLLAWPAGAQDATITPNYKDADIRQVIEAVGEDLDKSEVRRAGEKCRVRRLP